MLEIAWILIAVLVVAVVGGVLAAWWERRHPSSYTHRVGDADADNAALDDAERLEQGFVRGQAEWRRLGAEDEASLDVAEQAALDAQADAEEAAQLAVERSRVNALFHP